MDGTCLVGLAPTTITMEGPTFHPCVVMLMMSG